MPELIKRIFSEPTTIRVGSIEADTPSLELAPTAVDAYTRQLYASLGQTSDND